MGKSFKPETNITTGSPSIYLYNSLKKKRSKIFIWDPEVDQLSLEKFLVLNKLNNKKICYFIGTQHKAFLNSKFKNTVIKDQFLENISFIKSDMDLMNFELAASYRDRIKAITKIHSIQGINPEKIKDADIFALYIETGKACVKVYFIRYNQYWGNRDFYPKVSIDMTESEIMEAFLGQFYLNRIPAKLILVSNEINSQTLMEKLFTQKLGKSVKIINPVKGEKKELVSEREDMQHLYGLQEEISLLLQNSWAENFILV